MTCSGITPRSGFRRGRTSSARWTRRRACTEREILLLETFCPWKEHLYELEAEREMKTIPKFVLWRDAKGYRVSTIPLNASSFEFRKGYPSPGEAFATPR